MIDVSPSTTTLATTYTWLSDAISCRQHREVALYGELTTVGSAATLTLKFDFSPDGDTWYPVLDPETGLPEERPFTVADFGTTWSLEVQTPAANYLRVRAKSDTTTGSPAMTLGYQGDGALL